MCNKLMCCAMRLGIKLRSYLLPLISLIFEVADGLGINIQLGSIMTDLFRYWLILPAGIQICNFQKKNTQMKCVRCKTFNPTIHLQLHGIVYYKVYFIFNKTLLLSNRNSLHDYRWRQAGSHTLSLELTVNGALPRFQITSKLLLNDNSN